MFSKVNTLAVYVTDFTRAKKFYTKALGFEVSADLGENTCFLHSGNLYIYLEGGHQSSNVSAETVRLSFFLETEESVNKVYNKLKESGVRILQNKPQQVGADIFWFQFADPDGNILEVSGKP